MNSGFEALQIDKQWIKKLQEGGIVSPSPVQEAAIPEISAGRDVIVQAQTGSGKTLAFLLPILQRLDAKTKTTQAVVVVPTRELGMQIAREADRLMQGTGLSVLPLIGGAAIGRQIDKLRLHPPLVVGTPGRMLELVKMRKLRMHHVRTVVVDEVDSVFELGSKHEVEALIGSAPRDRQIVFLSATVPESVRETAKRWMNDPVVLDVHPSQRTADTIEHLFFISEENGRLELLRRLVRAFNPRAAIAFVSDTGDVAGTAAGLKRLGLSVEALSGNSGKQERARVMNAFREGKFQLLLATDVAARGLDLPDVTHVFNLDLPLDADHYVHRVGRTGRMGRKGTAVSLVSPKHAFVLEKFARTLGIDIHRKWVYNGKITDFAPQRRHASRSGGGKAAAGGKNGSKTLRGDISEVWMPAPEAEEIAVISGIPASAPRAASPSGPSAAGSARRANSAQRDKAAASARVAASPAGGKRKGRKGGRERDQDRDRKNKGMPRWLRAKPPL
jgi:superfamily II DNA/RNA helicase